MGSGPDRTDLLMRTTNDHEMILLPRPAPRAIIQLRTLAEQMARSGWNRGGKATGFHNPAGDRPVAEMERAEVEQHDCCSRRETMAQKRNRFPPAIRAQLSYLSSCHFGR